jgi:hypothetical protein
MIIRKWRAAAADEGATTAVDGGCRAHEEGKEGKDANGL